MRMPLLIIVSATFMVACGGGNNDGNDLASNDNILEQYSELQKTEVEPTVLKAADRTSLETHFKNGVRLNVYDYTSGAGGGSVSGDELAPSATIRSAAETADVASTESTSNDTFSTTNTHVANVDEADFVKYDGEYLFVASNYNYNDNDKIFDELDSTKLASIVSTQEGSYIRILQTDPSTASVEALATIATSTSHWAAPKELYLVSDEEKTTALVTIGYETKLYSLLPRPMLLNRAAQIDSVAAEPSVGGLTLTSGAFTEELEDIEVTEDLIITTEPVIAVMPEYIPPSIVLNSYSLEDVEQPELTTTLRIDGSLRSSRKIGNMLYLVTHFWPHLPNIDYYVTSDDEAIKNERAIANLTADDFLPKYSINDGDRQNLVKPSDCFLPADLDSKHGYEQFTSLVAIDLSSSEITSSICLNAQIDGVYANLQNMYIGGSNHHVWRGSSSFTNIHKFTLGRQLEYRSTGTVPGHLGWNDPSFRMDEHENHFRIVTSSRDDQGLPIHQLSVLKDKADSDQMELVAKLPNESKPEPIGKPREDIFAVRFMGQRAYIVTFERIDPLYVIDLADPTQPFIAGALEIPGFSNYLHPVGKDYLLGVGRKTDNRSSIKISLFHIDKNLQPSEINNYTIGGENNWSGSTALHDLRALSFLSKDNDTLRFSLPSLTDEEGSALQLFEITDIHSDLAQINFNGKIVAEEEQSKPYRWFNDISGDRSVLHDDAVYFIHKGQIWAAFWQSPNAATGPH